MLVNNSRKQGQTGKGRSRYKLVQSKCGQERKIQWSKNIVKSRKAKSRVCEKTISKYENNMNYTNKKTYIKIAGTVKNDTRNTIH